MNNTKQQAEVSESFSFRDRAKKLYSPKESESLSFESRAKKLYGFEEEEPKLSEPITPSVDSPMLDVLKAEDPSVFESDRQFKGREDAESYFDVMRQAETMGTEPTKPSEITKPVKPSKLNLPSEKESRYLDVLRRVETMGTESAGPSETTESTDKAYEYLDILGQVETMGAEPTEPTEETGETPHIKDGSQEYFDILMDSHLMEPPTDIMETTAEDIRGTFSDLTKLIYKKGHPVGSGLVQGMYEFVSAMPSFAAGVASAIGRTTTYLGKLPEDWSLMDIHREMMMGLEDGMTAMDWSVYKSTIPESRLVGEVVMVPATAWSMLFGKVSNMFDNEDVKGALRILGDVGGLVFQAKVMHLKAPMSKTKKSIGEAPETFLSEPAADIVKQVLTIDEYLKEVSVESAGRIEAAKARIVEDAKLLKENVEFKTTVYNKRQDDFIKWKRSINFDNIVADQAEFLKREEVLNRADIDKLKATKYKRYGDIDIRQFGLDESTTNAIAALANSFDMKGSMQIIFAKGKNIKTRGFLGSRRSEVGQEYQNYGMFLNSDTIKLGSDNFIYVLSHEFGHAVMYSFLNRAPQKVRDLINIKYNEWLIDPKNVATSKDARTSRGSKTLRRMPSGGLGPPSKYDLAFNEWFADEIGRWVESQEKPRGAYELYLEQCADSIKKSYTSESGKEFFKGVDDPIHHFEEMVKGNAKIRWNPDEWTDSMTPIKASPITMLETVDPYKSPFFTSARETERVNKLLRRESVQHIIRSDINAMTQKLINDVNMFLHHRVGRVKLDKAVETLRTLSLRSDNLVGLFKDHAEFDAWKTVIDEYYAFAKSAQRAGGFKERVKVKDFTAQGGFDSKLLHREDSFVESLRNWLRGETDTMPKPDEIFLYKDAKGKNLTYSPWYSLSFQDLHEKGYKPKQVYEVTSLEEIRFNGKTWEEIAMEAKKSYDEAVKAGNRNPRDAVEKIISETASGDLVSAKEGVVEAPRKVGEYRIDYARSSGSAPSPSPKPKKKKPSWSEYREKMDDASKVSTSRKIRDFLREAKKDWVDRSGDVRKILKGFGQLGRDALVEANLARGACAEAARRFKLMRKDVYKGYGKRKKRILNDYLLATRLIEVDKYKSAKQWTRPVEMDKVKDWVENLGEREGLTAEEVLDIKRRTESYYDHMNRALEDLFDEGIISEQEFNDLRQFKYRKFKLADIFDTPGGAGTRRRQIGLVPRSVYDSGIESLARGTEGDIFDRSGQRMALEVFSRTYGRIMNNRANKALLDITEQYPKNPFVRVRRKGDKEGRGRVTVPRGWKPIKVYVDGKQQSIYLSPEMFDGWIVRDPHLSSYLADMASNISGASVLRMFATGIDPTFAIRNLPRDMLHIFTSSLRYKDGELVSNYSPILPVAAVQMTKDLVTVFPDTFLRRGRYVDYIKEGGGMEFLVHQGRFKRGFRTDTKLDKVYDVLSYLNESSEILTRLANRERTLVEIAKDRGVTIEEVLKNPKARKEATHVARDVLDHNQGGRVSKAVDHIIPYFNSSIQGTRGLFRAAWEDPVRTTAKVLQLGTLFYGIRIASQLLRSKTTANISEDEFRRNLILPIFPDSSGFKDMENQDRFMYVKIPLDHSQRFFKTAFDAMADMTLGKEVNYGNVVKALGEFSPADTSTMPPLASALLGYFNNIDFYYKEKISGEELPYPYSRYESTEDTNLFLKQLGEITDLSPDRVGYILGEYFTNHGIYGQLLGTGYELAFGEIPKELKERHYGMILNEVPGVNDVLGITHPFAKHEKALEKAETLDTAYRHSHNCLVDNVVDATITGDADVADMAAVLDKVKDREEQERMYNRYKFSIGVKDLPEKSFWISLSNMTAKARAIAFTETLARYQKNGWIDEFNKQMNSAWAVDKTLSDLSIFTERFWDEVEKLDVKELDIREELK